MPQHICVFSLRGTIPATEDMGSRKRQGKGAKKAEEEPVVAPPAEIEQGTAAVEAQVDSAAPTKPKRRRRRGKRAVVEETPAEEVAEVEEKEEEEEVVAEESSSEEQEEEEEESDSEEEVEEEPVPGTRCLVLSVPLWTLVMYLHRIFTGLGLLIAMFLLYIPVGLTSYDLLGSVLGSVPLGLLAEFPLYLLMVTLPGSVDRYVHRSLCHTPLSHTAYAYMAPLIYMSSWYLCQVLSPYGTVACPANMFMHDWSVVYLPMSVLGIYGCAYMVLVISAHLSLRLETTSSASKTDCEAEGQSFHLTLVLCVIGALWGMSAWGGANYIRDAHPSPTAGSHMSLIGVTDTNVDPWTSNALTVTEAACAKYPDMVVQREVMNWLELGNEEYTLGPYRDLAVEYGVWLIVTGYVEDYSVPDGPTTNNAWLINDAGETALHYLKQHSAVGMEDIQEGTEDAAVVDTPFGKICVVICLDASFPSTVAACGRAGADLILSPAFDEPSMVSFMSPSIAARAVENGSVFARITMKGLTIGVDAYGNQLSLFDDTLDKSPGKMVSMTLPVSSGRFTLYPYLTPWLEDGMGILTLAGVVYVVIASKMGGKAEIDSEEQGLLDEC
ncbi:hypothetical protein KIPB_006859 [Kipferlia bialata]|uniref:CN hydrolase domain-containing protein n=1 Tax=Kipferlia bialata TaxID=797122 RepID=A0A9K3CZX0_9EUKA|nr:hypothetical protein KIPB_006859 [Kipferlia bialata]|eukprot:g6859.t1